MYALLIAAALAADPGATECYPTGSAAAAALAQEAQSGTLIFSTGDCLAVRVYTQSPYTHVAAIVVQDGQPLVYDSQNGIGVRRSTLEEYCRLEGAAGLRVYTPRHPFSAKRTALFVEHLEQELGRPYAVSHHMTGGRVEGIHCAEYMTDALMHCRLMRAEQPSRVSPASLRDGIVLAGLYEEACTVEVRAPAVEPEQATGWCSQLWIDTKTCTTSCCRKMSGWFFCR